MVTVVTESLDKDREKRHKVCRNRGGESCAFDGAMIVLQPVADAVHLVHGPISCCANSWQGRGTISEKGNFHKMGFTTDLTEIDIVVGTEDKLTKAIENIALEIKPEAIFVYSTCVTGLLGEDIERVCFNTGKSLGIDVIPVNAPGFVGPKNLGNRIAGEVLLEYVIGKEEPPFITERDINLIGEYNIAGDQFLIEPLLEEAGLRILSRITGNSTFREIKWAHRAKLNVIVCSRALVNIGIEMERRYGIPFVEVSFFGNTETAKALRSIGKLIDRDGSVTEKIEALINREEQRLNEELKKYEDIKGKKAVLYTGGVKSWSMISALKDLGIEVVAVGTKKSTYEDEEKIKELVGDECILFEDTSPANILKIMNETDAHILIAGGRNQYLAIKKGFPFVDVNQERHRAYAGYRGLINLAEDISRAIEFYSPKKITQPVVKSSKGSVSIDPLKNSPFVGAVMALQGVDRVMPLLHTAQGCNFLGKVLLIKHFREPIAMMSTKLFTEDVVMGGKDKLIKAIETFRSKGAKLIAVITSSLSHIKGEDIDELVKSFDGKEFKVIHIPLPDYEGSLEWGYLRAIESILNLIPEEINDKKEKQINIIAGGHLTPADFTELREIFELFALNPIFLPDLSALDGSSDFSPVTKGGTSLEEIKKMSASAYTVVIGYSLKDLGQRLKDRFGIPFRVFGSLSGIEANDEFFKFLSELSNREVPERLIRQRRVLIDGMRDVHFYLTGKKVVLALEPDLSVHISGLLEEMGISVELAILPEKIKFFEQIKAKEIIFGDLSNLGGDCDLIISNSHAHERAKMLHIPLYEMGFPVYKTFGYTHKVTIGYRGSLNIINDIANIRSRKEVHQ